MKRVLMLLVVVAVLFVVASVSGASDTVELTYSNFFPPTHIQSKLAEEWGKEVEKRTGGKVKVAYYPGGTLTKAKQCYDGVVEGLSDIGLSALAYSRGRFPTMAAVDLPLGYASGVGATKVANDVYAAFTPKELDDVQVMYFHAHGPGLLHSAKKKVEKLEDLKGLKLRATGNSAKVVKTLGGTPVAMSMPDSYQAIQKGVVDGGMYPMETNKGWKMAEVVDYMTETFPVAYTTTFFVVMNKDKWNALPEDAKKTIMEINAEWAPKHGKAWDDSDVAGKEAFLKEGGEIIPLSDAEGKRWVEASKPVIDEYIESVKAKNIDGKKVVEETVKALESTK